jgi:hypothetical protein
VTKDICAAETERNDVLVAQRPVGAPAVDATSDLDVEHDLIVSGRHDHGLRLSPATIHSS